ncbi:MAG: aminomethyl-transferring glycine dehydrogenase subunit GcvPB [Clostridia bacterium]|nr:aminomethyl-transferring glycine dehydrogenase subunit GcvPB [Clostridia bacterium]
MRNDPPLLFERSRPGRQGVRTVSIRDDAPAASDMIPPALLRSDTPLLPEMSEADVLRHYTVLSRRNFGLDDGFYPLGSCTMKHNPRIGESLSRLSGFADLHPDVPDEDAQGALQLMGELQDMLAEIAGMDAFSLAPAAGAHGELTGLLVLRAWHGKRGDTARNRILVPDSAHGTNPASASAAGFEVLQVPSAPDGTVDIEALRAMATGPDSGRIAGLMLTNPNTLGLFETRIREIADIVHGAGGLLYYDGANLNAIMGVARPGDMGFDIVHLNLHKTFATPHGGGGPGAGPVGVKAALAGFLPSPVIRVTTEPGREGPVYRRLSPGPDSIGRVRENDGNFGVLVRAYAYILAMGGDGLAFASRMAVLNANYLRVRLAGMFHVPYDRICMHEFVLSGLRNADGAPPAQGSTLSFAKRMLDFGIHPPTVYFPLIVPEAMMIEPTESESPETLDDFAGIMETIAAEAVSGSVRLEDAPFGTPVRRIDEVRAARSPVLRWTPGDGDRASG